MNKSNINGKKQYSTLKLQLADLCGRAFHSSDESNGDRSDLGARQVLAGWQHYMHASLSQTLPIHWPSSPQYDKVYRAQVLFTNRSTVTDVLGCWTKGWPPWSKARKPKTQKKRKIKKKTVWKANIENRCFTGLDYVFGSSSTRWPPGCNGSCRHFWR